MNVSVAARASVGLITSRDTQKFVGSSVQNPVLWKED